MSTGLALSFAATILAGPPSGVEAQVPPRSAVKGPRLILLATRAQRRLASRALEALRAQLSDTRIVVELRLIATYPRGDAESRAVARKHGVAGTQAVIWCDLDSLALLHIWRPGPATISSRRILHMDAASRLESLAIMARGNLSGLVAKHRLGPRRATPAPRPRVRAAGGRPVTPRRPRPPRALPARPLRPDPPLSPTTAPAVLHSDGAIKQARQARLAVGAGYHFVANGAQALLAHGGTIFLEVRLWSALGLRLAYRPEQPATRTNQGAELTVWQHPLELSLRYHHRWGGFELSGALGLGAAYVKPKLRQVDARVVALDDSPHGSVWVLPALGLSWRITDRFRLGLELGCRVLLNPMRYELNEQGERSTLLRLWTLQPVLQLGFHTGIW